MVITLRKAAAVAIAGMLLAGTAGLASGSLALVTTHGVSMLPRVTAGDLVVVRSSTYEVGDVVAYRSRELKQVVLHRVVGREGQRYLFQGDNNDFVDPEKPTGDHLVGKELLRIPAGGIWLGRLTSPTNLAVFAFALLAGGGGTFHTRRRRRDRQLRRRRATVARHAARISRLPAMLSTMSPRLRAVAAGTAVVGALGLALGALSWTGPVGALAPSRHAVNRSMTFSYAATVPRTPAYDGTTVSSPDPVFRRLTNAVDVRFAYQGSPGTVTVDAMLSSPGGWHSTVALRGPQAFTGDRYDATVALDLAALDRRAQAAAAVTGVAADQLTIALTPRVTSINGTTFAPALQLVLDPLQLKLGDPEALTVTGTTEVRQSTRAPRTLSLLNRQLDVATARTVSVVTLIVAVLAVLILVPVVRWSASGSESAMIRRRYAPLLVAVHPMPMPAGRPVVDVTEFVILAKLAERYGLLVLHWSRSDVDTFIVQDDGTTYRYRSGDSGPASPSPNDQDQMASATDSSSPAGQK